MGVQKNIFPEMGAGVCKKASALFNRFQSTKSPYIPLEKGGFLFKKFTPAFLEHSLFLLVFKQIADVAL
jgi:hypothetical protein